MSNELQILIDTAKVIKTSSFIPSHLKSEGELVTAMMFIQELGLPMISGLQNVSVIKGKPTLGSHLLWAIVMKQKDLKKVSIDSGEGYCTVEIIRSIGEFKSTFTMEDAKRAGLVSPNSGWEKYPKQMLEARAKSNCARLAYPEAISGIYSIEEMRDSDNFKEDTAINREPRVVENEVKEARVANTQESQLSEHEIRLNAYIKRTEKLMSDKTLTAQQGLHWINEFKSCENEQCLIGVAEELGKILKGEVKENTLGLDIDLEEVERGLSEAWDRS